MRLARGSLFLGIVAPEIILDCTRQLAGKESFDLDQFCYALGAPGEEAQQVLDAMVNAGYVRDNQSGSSPFEPTKEFTRLNLATIGDGLTRNQAKALLEKVLAKAVEVNANPAKYHGVGVIKLAVFGSYLSGTDVLSDLDLGFDTIVTSQEHHRKALESAMSGRSLFSRKGPLDKLRGVLRCRSKYVSLHTMAEVQQLGTPFVIVLQDGKPTAALK